MQRAKAGPRQALSLSAASFIGVSTFIRILFFFFSLLIFDGSLYLCNTFHISFWGGSKLNTSGVAIIILCYKNNQKKKMLGKRCRRRRRQWTSKPNPNRSRFITMFSHGKIQMRSKIKRNTITSQNCTLMLIFVSS